MALSPLAAQIYEILRTRIAAERIPTLTIKDLSKAVGAKAIASNAPIVEALGDIAKACQAASLPVITGIVVQGGKDKQLPSPAYFALAHPDVAQTEWPMRFRLDLVKITRTAWPPALPDVG